MMYVGKAIAKRRIADVVLASALCVSLLTFIPPVAAASGMYSEDFTTTTYLDDAMTTVDGWGEGSLSLPHRTPEIIATCPTLDYAWGVAVSGAYAYVAVGESGLQIFNITDRSHPTAISSVALLTTSLDVSVEGSYAYVASCGLIAASVNISDPCNPVFIDYYAPLGVTPPVTWGIHVAWPYLYSASTVRGGLMIWNITQPGDLVGFYNTTGEAEEVVVRGNYAYVADGTSGLQIINITDRTNPISVGSYVTPGYARSVCTDGRVAYVADYTGLVIINVTNPRSPTFLGSCDTPGVAYGLTVSERLAYIADSESGLHAINVTDPENPVLAWTCDDPIDPAGSAHDVVVEGSYAYIANGDSGLQIVQLADIIDYDLVREIGHCHTDFAYGVHVVGSYAYVAQFGDGLGVVDVTNPLQPVLVGTCDTIGLAYDVFVAGTYAYVADEVAGLRVINVTDPRNPEVIGTYNTPNYAYGVWVQGEYAYVADATTGLLVIDVSDPEHPSLVGTYNSPGQAFSVQVVGAYAYLADQAEGLQIVDLTHPETPTRVGTYNSPGSARGLCVVWPFVYLADTTSGLQVVNVTDPRDPVPVGSLDYEDDRSALAVHVCGQYAGLAFHNPDSLLVVNVTDPTNPIPCSGGSLYSFPCGVWVTGEHAYFVDDGYGLAIVELMDTKIRQFEPTGVAVSLPVVDADSAYLVSATLTCDQSVLPGYTSISYELSPDNGINWEGVTPGVEHVFIHAGSQLRWRAVFSGWKTMTPTLAGLSVVYETRLNAPFLVSPDSDSHTNDSTPSLQWDSVSDAASYLLQLDTVVTFDSDDLWNVTVSGSTTSYSPVSPLADGTWYWRVAANDSDGLLGVFSQTRSFVLDATEPAWVEVPSDRVLQYGERLVYDLNASDTSGIDHYWVDDVTHFSIDSDGVLADLGVLLAGDYPVTVRAYDEFNNYCEASFTVEVQGATTTTTTTTTTTSSTTTTTGTTTATSQPPIDPTVLLVVVGLGGLVVVIAIVVLLRKRS